MPIVQSVDSSPVTPTSDKPILVTKDSITFGVGVEIDAITLIDAINFNFDADDAIVNNLIGYDRHLDIFSRGTRTEQ